MYCNGSRAPRRGSARVPVHAEGRSSRARPIPPRLLLTLPHLRHLMLQLSLLMWETQPVLHQIFGQVGQGPMHLAFKMFWLPEQYLRIKR